MIYHDECPLIIFSSSQTFEDFQPCLFFWCGRPRYSTQDRLVSATRCRKRPIDYQCPNLEAKRPKAYRSNDVEVHGTSNLNGGGLHTSGLLNLVPVAKKMLYVEWDCLVGIVVMPSEVWLLFFLHDGKHPAIMDENGSFAKWSSLAFMIDRGKVSQIKKRVSTWWYILMLIKSGLHMIGWMVKATKP